MFVICQGVECSMEISAFSLHCFEQKEGLQYLSTNTPVAKDEGRMPETLATGVFVPSNPGMTL